MSSTEAELNAKVPESAPNKMASEATTDEANSEGFRVYGLGFRIYGLGFIGFRVA